MAKKKDNSIKVLTPAAMSKKYGGSGLASVVLRDVELWIPSRFLALNDQFGGGIPYGGIVELYGEESSGKSLLAQDFAYGTQQLGGVVIFADAEKAFTKQWSEANGLELDKVWLYQENTVELISDWVRDSIIYWRSILVNNEPILLILDSLAVLECLENQNTAQESKKAEMGNRAKAISTFLRLRSPLFHSMGVGAILINQLRKKIGASNYEDPDTTPGGEATKFYASIRAGVYGGKQIVKKIRGVEERVGRHTSIRIKKNKVAPPKKTIKAAEVHFVETKGNPIGFNKYFGLPDLLISKEVISRKKGSSSYMMGDKMIARGEEKFLELLYNDDKLRSKLIRRAGINTISTTQKQLDEIKVNLYPVTVKSSKDEESEE